MAAFEGGDGRACTLDDGAQSALDRTVTNRALSALTVALFSGSVIGHVILRVRVGRS